MSGYIGPLPVPQGIQRKQSFTATAGQTTFNTNGYTDGNFITVYLNGVRLINGTDYTATNGSDVVLTTAAAASDVLDFETFQTFSLVNQTFDNVTLKNPTHEDTDGGRESAVSFKGEQSGGEISTLAAIQASHDGTADDQKGDLIFKTNDGSDNNAPTEAARIDSGQNLLIGTTSTTVYTSGSGGDAGVNLRADGQISNSSNSASVFNRMASNGPINLFYKDGSEVGRIAVDSNDNIMFGATTGGGAGFYLHGSGGTDPFVLPMKENALSDNTVTLGDSSRRYKDIFLGGGAYIGGTGASNHLEDYEEGTFTPTNGALVGLTIQNGRYTKIGNLVHVDLRFNWTSTTGSAGLTIGLPFGSAAASNSGSTAGTGAVFYSGPSLLSGAPIVAHVGAGANVIAFYKGNGGTSFTALSNTNVNGAFDFLVSVTYHTT